MEKNQVYDYLIKKIPREQIKLDEPMKKHINFKIGGNADFYLIVKSIEQVQHVLKLVKENGIPLTILGNGSNVLVGDNGIRGIVLKVSIEQFKIDRKEENAVIEVGAGELLGKVAYLLANNNVARFEFASGIPGSIGRSN